MFGIVLVTHGRVGEEMLHALETIVGPQPQAQAVSIAPEDDMEQRRADIVAAIAATEGGAGVVLLTDMFGGTPSNLALSLLPRGQLEVIAGVNLPLLIKLASLREGDMARAVHEAQEAGRKYINVASRLLQTERS